MCDTAFWVWFIIIDVLVTFSMIPLGLWIGNFIIRK